MFQELNERVARTFPIAPLQIGAIEHQTPIRRPDAFFADHQILWVIGGHGRFTLGGKVYHLSTGQGAFMRAGTSYAYEAEDGPLSTRWVAFAGGDCVLAHYGIGAYFLFDVPSYLNDATERLEARCRRSSHPLCAGYTMTWLSELLDTLFEGEAPLADRVDRYLTRYLDRPITLTDVADALGIDRFKLCRLYRAERGTTVMHTLTHIRVRMAKQLLREGGRSVNEIAALCGYEHTSYFIKVFREVFGRTPSAYRASLKR